ncbi:MAG TPA: hypothetical protein VME63_11405 [Dyella sp.]|uniref:hypothetical protein n=1 Tax=Dyella sp. TaxID=1869338 RepID=UPI002C8E488C|nr:hypothetical protein [Dyella sp.]HTV86009.1 hypothetical protein [Dyella sp.]
MSRFSVDFVSPVEYEWLAAEISYDGQLICRVSNERSDRELEVQFAFDARIGKVMTPTVPLRELMTLLEDVAKEVQAFRDK